MASIVLDAHGSVRPDVPAEDVAALLEGAKGFWVDVMGGADERQAAVGRLLAGHPLLLEDIAGMRQRAKVEAHQDFGYVVLFAVSEGAEPLVEVHCVVTQRGIVTLHASPVPALDELRGRHAEAGEGLGIGARAFHAVADALVDAYVPVLDTIDERLDAVQEEIFRSPRDVPLQEVVALRRRLAVLRKAVAGQRSVLTRILDEPYPLPGTSDEVLPYLRDVEDHLARLAEGIDLHRDIVNGTTDVYLSLQSTRLGDVTKRLTLIATVFLPLTFITGFFGQNFGWMVDHIRSGAAFALLGFVLPIVAILALLTYFWRRSLL